MATGNCHEVQDMGQRSSVRSSMRPSVAEQDQFLYVSYTLNLTLYI